MDSRGTVKSPNFLAGPRRARHVSSALQRSSASTSAFRAHVLQQSRLSPSHQSPDSLSWTAVVAKYLRFLLSKTGSITKMGDILTQIQDEIDFVRTFADLLQSGAYLHYV
jgi:hypothetical protein